MFLLLGILVFIYDLLFVLEPLGAELLYLREDFVAEGDVGVLVDLLLGLPHRHIGHLLNPCGLGKRRPIRS